MKPGDLVRNKNSESGEIGLFLRWHTFDKDTNPLTFPIVRWADGRTSSIQTNLLELVSASR
jgi:hypothetical protein